MQNPPRMKDAFEFYDKIYHPTTGQPPATWGFAEAYAKYCVGLPEASLPSTPSHENCTDPLCKLRADPSAVNEALPSPPPQPTEWINEDELPEGYPYDEMFPCSKLGHDGSWWSSEYFLRCPLPHSRSRLPPALSNRGMIRRAWSIWTA